MLGHRRSAWHLAASVVLAAVLATVPLDRISLLAAASDGCTLADEVRATTCRLNDGINDEGRLDGPGSTATYRVDILGPGATLNVLLLSENDSLRATLLDWRGDAISQTKLGIRPPEQTMAIPIQVPGAYGLKLEGDVPSGGSGYSLGASIVYSQPVGLPVWPTGLATGDGPLTSERREVRVPRGGTPDGSIAAARILGIPPDGVLADFTLVADVQFERIAGPAAVTVRFRYEPEAGGGTGYFLSIDPFAGTASLDTFDEGRRRSIVGHQPLSIVPTADGANRLVLTAVGASIRATLDGQEILEVTDSRFSRGLIAIGAVTWSDPVAVTFDHIQVTTPPR